MTFLRRLFSKDINPDEHERVRCDACDGTGKYRERFEGQWRYSMDSCWKCHGKGWLLVKRSD